MAEINAKDLTAKTSPASTDSMLLFGTTSNEGAKITVDNLADDILGRLATKTFPNQVGGSSAATILAQLATLNSKTIYSFTKLANTITMNAGGAGFIALVSASSNPSLQVIAGAKYSSRYMTVAKIFTIGYDHTEITLDETTSTVTITVPYNSAFVVWTSGDVTVSKT